MSDFTERSLGWGFGLLGGLLFLAGALVALIVGSVDLAFGHTLSAIGNGGAAVVLFVLGAVAILFSSLAHGSWKGHPLTPGIILVVTGVIGWGVLGFGNVVALVGAVFVFLAGLLLLIPSAVSGVKTLATA
jgi:hypothetical protein